MKEISDTSISTSCPCTEVSYAKTVDLFTLEVNVLPTDMHRDMMLYLSYYQKKNQNHHLCLQGGKTMYVIMNSPLFPIQKNRLLLRSFFTLIFQLWRRIDCGRARVEGIVWIHIHEKLPHFVEFLCGLALGRLRWLWIMVQMTLFEDLIFMANLYPGVNILSVNISLAWLSTYISSEFLQVY